MDNIKVINSGNKYAHVSVGEISTFSGKQFIKDATGASSCEISFGTLGEGESVPFFHSHKANEENYIILTGTGRFQVGNDVFDVGEGSVVKVSTGCGRNLKCTSRTPMTYICIQAREGRLDGYTMADAEVVQMDCLI